MHASKGLKRFVSIGLLLILSITLVVSLVKRKRKWGLLNRVVLQTSKYRAIAPYVIAQSKFETKNLESHVYEVDNNLFGMKMPTKRQYLGTVGLKAPDGGNYQHYKTDTQSIRDLFLYFDYVKFPTSVKDADQYNDELFRHSYYGTGKDVERQAYLAGLNAYL